MRSSLLRFPAALRRALLLLAASVVALVAGAAPASAAVSYVGSGSDNGTASFFGAATASPAVPAATQTGDLMVATVSSGASGGWTSTAFVAPSGWTLLDSQTASATQATYYRIATASGTASYSWTYNYPGGGGGASVAAVIDVYTGVDSTNPITAGVSTTGSGTAVSLPNDTATLAGSMRISTVATYSSSTSNVPTSTFQAGLTLTAQDSAATGMGVHVAGSYAAQGVGVTPTRTDTLSKSVTRWMAQTYIANPAAPAKVAFTTDPVGGVAEGVNFPTQPVVKVQYASGATVLGDTSTVTLAIASGPAGGVLNCTGGLSKAAVNGVVTFAGCQITGTAAAGTYTITASTPGLTSDTSNSFTIVAGAAAKVVFTTQPVGGVAEGVALPTQPVVKVQDSFGNTVTGNTSTVTLAIASGPAGGVLSCTGGLGKAATAGVSTFAGCQITGTAAAGTYTVAATDGALTGDTSNSFTIIVGAAAKVAFTTQPVGGVGEGVALPTQPVVTVQDSYGNTVTGNTSTVTLAIASGPAGGVLSCTGGLGKAATAGVSTFAGCQITGTAAAGTYTVTATDGALTSATSSSFVITVGAATKVVFTTQPVGGVAEGVNFATQPVAKIQDADGNTVTSDISTVTLAIASGPGSGVLSCTGGLAKAATAGVVTFAGCQITGTAAAGTYTLSAVDGALTGDTSSSFTIVAGAATKVAFTTQPVGGVAEGVALPTQPVVTIQDAYSNTVTGNTSTVTLAIASGPGSGVLSCTGGLGKAATAGVSTFAGCQITGTAAAGTYTVTATDGALTSATSSSFTIVVGAATKVVFTTQPVGGVAEGVNFPTQPVATIQDASGNTVTGDTSTVTLAIASGPGAGVLSCTGGLAKAATAGVVTFAGCQITGSGAAGTYTLSATDGALTSATSSAITIIFGAAAKLAFITQPVGGVMPGANWSTQPAVAIKDAYDNTVTSNTSSVTLAIASGPGGTLACTTNPLAATAGGAAFSGCKINNTPGVYTLTATDGALTSATSSSFTIIAGALSLATSSYSFTGVTLTGQDQLPTATLPLNISDTSGSGAGWRITATAAGWTGGTSGALSAVQRVNTPPAATCDGGPGTCTLATTSALTYPLTLTSTPTVVYNAGTTTGLGPQTVNLPLTLPITGGLQALGTFNQNVTLSITSGP